MHVILKVVSAFSLISYVYSLCPSGFIKYNSQSCFSLKYFEHQITMDEAEAICKNDSNAVLASIDNKIQENFLISNLMNDPDINYLVWIGLKRNPKDMQKFIWSDGNNSTYRNWVPGEPNMYEGKPEYCVHFDIRSFHGLKDSGWNDAPCDYSIVQGALCKLPYETLSDTEKKHFTEVEQANCGSEVGVAIGATIAVLILLAIIAFAGYIGFRKWKRIYPIIPPLRFKNESA